MKACLTFILCIHSTFLLFAQTDKKILDGPVMQFDTTFIVDTIKISDLNIDTINNYYRIKNPASFIFKFKNTGTKPLIVSFTGTGDPDFICNYPKLPVPPGGIDSLQICTTVNKLYIHKNISIQSNSILQPTIHYKRVNATKYGYVHNEGPIITFINSIPSDTIYSGTMAAKKGKGYNLEYINMGDKVLEIYGISFEDSTSGYSFSVLPGMVAPGQVGSILIKCPPVNSEGTLTRKIKFKIKSNEKYSHPFMLIQAFLPRN